MNKLLSVAVSVPKTCVRRLPTTEVKCKSTFANIKQQQIHFQKEDDVPVYLKGGAKDTFMFLMTCSLIFGSLAGGFYNTFKLMNKK